MKNYLVLFLVLSFQSIFSQNTESAGTLEAPIYEPKEVDKMPDFPGGIIKFYQYVGNDYKLPTEDKSGKIYTKFVIEIDGSISNIQVVRDEVGGASEAIKLFRNSPKWIPGEKNGEKVRTRYSLPIKIN